MDSAEFHASVYQAVRQIPFGKVTSYGHIAKLIGMPRHSRHVGQALKFLDPNTDIPWQRVISSNGKVSSRGPGTTGAQRQREALEAEGVEVRVTRENEFAVRWDTYGWFPQEINLEIEGDAENPEEGANGQSNAEAGAIASIQQQ